MPHISRKVWQHYSQVIAFQDPVFQAFNGISVAKTMDSRPHCRVGYVRHQKIIPEMGVCSTFVHLSHNAVVASGEKKRRAITEPVELINISDNAFRQAVRHRNQAVFHILSHTNRDDSRTCVYIVQYKVQGLRYSNACAIQKAEQEWIDNTSVREFCLRIRLRVIVNGCEKAADFVIA